MGLDVSYYSGLKKIDCVYDEDGNPIDPVTKEEIHDAIIIEKNSFEAGSYSGYNEWRERLARLGGYQRGWHDYKKDYSYSAGAWAETGGPFWELINFSDCEGSIGSVVSAKLYKDFVQYREEALKITDHGFIRLYDKSQEAFRVASNNGVVTFN